LLRVCTRHDAEYDDRYFPQKQSEAEPRFMFYPVSLVSRFAAENGPDRTNVVMVEVDEARLHGQTRAPMRPENPNSPAVTWARWAEHSELLGIHELVPLPDGGYEPAEPWAPTYP
jgi:hypothetical protein